MLGFVRGFRPPVPARLTLRRHFATASTFPDTVTLRPYQESCLQACTDALASGVSRIGVSLPTGSGKTTVFVSLISRLLPNSNNPTAKQALIIVNSIELARQAARQVEILYPQLHVEIEQGINHKATGNADVTVATYQTLLRSQRLAKFDPNKLGVVVVDEAHHAAAPSYRRILSHFDANIRSPDVDFPPPILSHTIPIIGFSATFSRHDGLALGSVFQKIVYHRDFLQMIKERWLCNVRFTSVKAKLDLSEVTINMKTGDFNPTSLAHVINTETINKLVVQTWLDRASSRRSTLVFCVTLHHLRGLTEAFRQAGVDARYIYASTPAAERKALIHAFKSGDFPVLLNVAILTEGADIPNIDCVVVARPTRSRNVFAQMIGRGMRLSPKTGKADCHIIDFVESTSQVSGIVSTPTLFGLDPDIVVEDETLESLEARADSSLEGIAGRYDSANVGEPTSVTYVDYENPFSLVQESSGAPHISKMSSYAWVGCGGDIYVLECLGKGYIRIEPVQGDDGEAHFSAHYTPANLTGEEASAFKKSRFLKRRKVLSAATLNDAVRGCDTYATTKVVFGPMVLSLSRSARWRTMPASQSQKAFLAKRFKINATPTEDAPGTQTVAAPSFKVDNLTKGEAANIITRLKHGAQSRYAKKARQEAKAARATEKERHRKLREHVKVGPLLQSAP